MRNQSLSQRVNDGHTVGIDDEYLSPDPVDPQRNKRFCFQRRVLYESLDVVQVPKVTVVRVLWVTNTALLGAGYGSWAHKHKQGDSQRLVEEFSCHCFGASL